MSKQCRPWWLRPFLAVAVVVPVATGIGLTVHSVHTDEGWAAPRSGFALLGLAMFTPVLVIIAVLAIRAAVRRDAEAHVALAGFFAVVAGLFTISLGDAAAVALGLRAGQLPVVGLVFVGGSWAYSVIMALGHWYLYRVFRQPAQEPGGPSAVK